MVTTEGSDVHPVGGVAGCSCAYDPGGWRDVFAAYLVHAGLQLATRDGRNRIMKVISDEWRARVGRQLAMSRHPAGKGRPDHQVRHLADRMDAAYRQRRRTDG